MSSETRPITAAQFRMAIQDLPFENLYSKAREIQNSISHLSDSNKQLKEYSDSLRREVNATEASRSSEGRQEMEEGDQDCLDAIRENDVVIERQRERVELLREEVERRGGRWDDGGGGDQADTRTTASNGTRANPRPRLTDEELRRQLTERMDLDEDGDADGGLHL
jgi:hypothetical protein